MRLLVVDDDEAVRDALADLLARPGLEVRKARDADTALRLLDEEVADVVFTDVRMPGMDGVELLQRIRGSWPWVQVILMTAYDEMGTVVEAMREGARDFLVKPLDPAQLRELVSRILAERSRGPEQGTLLEAARTGEKGGERGASMLAAGQESHRLVGRHPQMIEAFKAVGQAAGNRVNVLIRGESGTGKELMARAIHFSSQAADRPFVAVNCASIPPTLLESELFGHVKGAFTGAVAQRKGRLAAAGSGTLFLDEVGDTPPEFQAKLLRVLQEGEYYPVGADRPAQMEARVIGATHRDLEAAVEEGRFRADLYFRICVLEILIPPLRGRKGDIPELARYLLGRIVRRLGKPPLVLSKEALELLVRHDWPGNVRELENSLTRGAVLAGGSLLRPGDLGLRNMGGSRGPGIQRSLDEMEGEHVSRVFESTGRHRTRTAEILEISRPRLNRLIQKHGLEG